MTRIKSYTYEEIGREEITSIDLKAGWEGSEQKVYAEIADVDPRFKGL